MTPLPRALLAALLALTTAAGCASPGGGDDAASADAIEGVTQYPLTLENCGREVVVDGPPQRAIALNQGSTEILLSLGLADRIAGTTIWTDPVRENLAADNARVPRLADDEASFERVLAEEPDFASASFERAFDHGAARGGRDRYESVGVPTYLAPSDCGIDGEDERFAPVTMDDIYREIRELATVFDVPGRGEAFVAELRGRVDAALADRAPADVSVAYWFADTSTPYMAGCCGSSGVISETVGVRNAFADTTAEWPQINWETVAARDPDVLVLGDLSRRRISGDALDSKLEFLRTHPVTSQLRAVREQRFVVLNGADMNPSIRTVDGVEKLAEGLAALPPI